MTSSSYCELILREGGAETLRLAVQSWEIPQESAERPQLAADRLVELTLRRGRAASLLRLRLEHEELLRLYPERGEWTVQLTEPLREQHGLAEMVVEEAPVDEPASWSRVLSLTLSIEADPAFRRLHKALVAELEEVHLALARDVVSRTWHRHGAGGEVRALSAEDDLRKLGEIFQRLERALDSIGEQPSRALRRRRMLAVWRPGDCITSLAANRLALDGALRRSAAGRLPAPRKALIERAELVTDIEEHRQMRSGLLRLAERSAALGRHCRRAVDLLEAEEGRWSGEALAQKTVPRIEGLERIRDEADKLQARFRRLLERLPFLAAAGAPRTRLGPTPTFLGRPAYREVYRALMEARRHAGGRFDGEGLRVRFRNLATLYEYWLFVKVVGLLREEFGAPEGDGAFSLIDEVYRPELAPGQTFRFRLPRGGALLAAYEPDFPPLGAPGRARYRSALVSGALRPDVIIQLDLPGEPPAMLALDAKSGPRFRRAQERLHESADYLWLIHDPHTGHQPLRQLFLIHRDADALPICNVPGYLEGKAVPAEARILGALPAWPGGTDLLARAIARFLETQMGRG